MSGGPAGDGLRFTVAELRFIAQRVTEDCRANPSPLPLLTETGPTRIAGACSRGHAELVMRSGVRACLACDRENSRRAHQKRKAGALGRGRG